MVGSKEKMKTLLFVVANSEDVGIPSKTYKPLVDMGHKVIYLSTEKLCCEKSVDIPDVSLNNLGIPFKKLSDYKTYNVVKILKQEKPDLVVVGSDSEFVRRAFVIAGNYLKIPTIMYQLTISSNAGDHSVVALKRSIYRLRHFFWNILKKYTFILNTVWAYQKNPFRICQMVYNDFKDLVTVDDSRGLHGCSIVAVSCNWEKTMMIKRGIPAERIALVGNPTYTHLFKGNVHSVDKSTYGLSNERVILFLTCAMVEHGRWTPKMREDLINGVIDKLKPLLNNGAKLIIKIHPVEVIDAYKEILSKRNESISLYKDNLSDLTNLSDVVIVGSYSTAVLETSALHKPSIVLNIYNDLEAFPYEEMGLGVCIYDLNNLYDLVNKLLYDKDFNKAQVSQADSFFGDNIEFIDGKANDRLIELILRTAK